MGTTRLTFFSSAIFFAALMVPAFGCGGKSESDSADQSDSEDESDSEDTASVTMEGTAPGDCEDGADNDADGSFDCDDMGCAGSPVCETAVEGQSAGDCSDGADNDLDGAFDCQDPGCEGSPDCVPPTDADGDGYYYAEDDCNDADASIHPGVRETCRTEADDNCDGNPNEQDADTCIVFYADNDGDGYGNAVEGRCRCYPAGGEVSNNTDSNDGDPAVH